MKDPLARQLWDGMLIPIMKWVKFIAAFLLLPLCLGSFKALSLVGQVGGRADMVWVPMLAGAACWAVVFLMLPKPMLIYVFGHELTHALWTWLFLGKVKRFKAAAKGGHVVVTKNNFLIVLAPYFFPLYATLVVAIFTLGHVVGPPIKSGFTYFWERPTPFM
jgi:hypothetical protein